MSIQLNKIKRLLITFSNGVQCSGVMSINFAIEHVAKLFNTNDIRVHIYEVCEVDNSLTLLLKQVDGEWKEISIE